MHRTAELSITTGRRHIVEITDEVRRFVAETATDGVVVVFVPHATCGVALIETGSGSEEDLDEVLGRVFPRDDRYRHRHGSRGHGGDHLLPAFVSPSVTIPVLAGALRLGTWQSVVLVDPNEDNPDRRVVLTLLD